MTDTAHADRFAAALPEMERSGSADRLVARFDEGAELSRPELFVRPAT